MAAGAETQAAAAAAGGEPTWRGVEPPEYPAPGRAAKAAGYARLAAAVLVTALLLVVYVAFRAVEKLRPSFRARERVQRLWARIVGRIAGLRVRRVGVPMAHGGALVSNHVSWSDIFVLVGAARMTFVSKAEVRAWPGVGAIAALCDTVFIERRRSAAKAQEAELRGRMQAGDRLLFFPEGTSTDGRRVLPFRSTLFAALMSEELRETAWVQPVSVVYHAPRGEPEVFYGWWGDMPFGGHVWTVLTRSFGGRAEVVFHPPVRAADFADRKALAAHCWREVEKGLRERL